MQGTYTAIQHMSTQNGGKGGVVVNVASLAGTCRLINLFFL